MGSKASKASSFFGSKNIKPQVNKKYLDTDIKCPACKKIYPKNSLTQDFKNHLKVCLQMNQQSSDYEQPIADFIFGNEPNNKMHQKKFVHIQNYIYQKVPVDILNTKFKWQKKQIQQFNTGNLIGLKPDQVRMRPFQQKNYWFRYHLQRKRIPWTSGADYMKIQKTNVLMSSLVEYQKVNMHKEVKIEFIGDKVNDAGGLLRQWIHMVIKEIFDQETGIFSIANTDDISYKLQWDQQMDQQFSQELFVLFGVIVGKAIFQKIPIMSYLDRTILRQLCNQKIRMEDIYGFDKGLYQSWNFMRDNSIDQMGLQTFFTVHRDGNTVQQIQLIEGGKDIEVTDVNKQLYIDSCIEFLCQTAIKRSLEAIKKGIAKVISPELLSVFEPYELEMILYGVPFINVADWKQNTQYKGKYTAQHKVIEWFWSLVQHYDQQKLANLLHFCTGSNRTPIQGFKKLQSNRGNTSKFLIQSTDYDKKNPYPKGHTCFNRLQLPTYPTKQMLQTYMNAIASHQLDGVFGLD